MRKKSLISILSFLLLIVLPFALNGAYLKNVPIKLIQPNGVILNAFASGDEFYNWVHDKDGYTIIQDPQTGYYVYAIKRDGDLVPSYAFPGLNNPQLLNIPKHLKHSVDKRPKPEELFPYGSPANVEEIQNAPRTGTINNIVIFIRFSDESEFTDSISTYNAMFNNSAAGANSMHNYFEESSYNQLSIATTFYPIPTTTVVSYQDSYPRAYYQPYNAITNPIGYQSHERTSREHTLLKNAVDAVSSQIPSGLDVDGDSDGYVDNVCFIIYGSPGAWADLLWPHMWSLYSQTAYINGKRVYTYNFQLQTSLGSSGVGVLCHEMFHSLGAPDLYHYSHDGLNPVYTWGLMGYTSNPPRHMGSYMKYRYGTWISSIAEITTSGTHSLNPLYSSSNNCYKIASPYSTTEYFIVEYRQRLGTFENSIPGEGLVVYRINSSQDGLGNRNGPPDEVYIYRPNGTLIVDGNPSSAHFSANVGRTAINDSTNPSSFLSDGSSGGLDISNIGSIGGTISFDVAFSAPTTHQLNVQSSPDTGASVTVSPDDINGFGNGTTNFSRTYNEGTTVSLTAPSTLNTRNFEKWTLDGADYSTNLSISVSMNSSHTAVAIYTSGTSSYNLSISATTGGTTNPDPGVYSHSSGEIVGVEAIPDPGFWFSSWTGDVSPADRCRNPVSIAMNSDKSITAHFARWRQISNDNSESVSSVNLDADVREEVIGDFGVLGLWSYDNNTSWRSLTGENSSALACGDIDNDGVAEIFAGFGSLGLWVYDNISGWRLISSEYAENLTCGDLDNNGQDEVIGDFGALGLWSYDNNTSWRQIDTINPVALAAGDIDNDGYDEVIRSGTEGVYVYDNYVGWRRITPDIAEDLVCGDLDNNGLDEVIADFSNLGMWSFNNNTSWGLLTGDNPGAMTTGDYDNDGSDEVASGFGVLGLWVHDTISGWTNLSPDIAENVTSGDLDNNGLPDIIGDFSSLGVWVYKN